MTDSRRRLGSALLAAAAMLVPASALAQSRMIENQARATQLPPEPQAEVGGWPKLGFDTVAALEYAGFNADQGQSRGWGPSLRLDSSFLAEFDANLSVSGLFQFKPREPLAAGDPNSVLYINQGAGRREGGKMKELYVRYGAYRIGKFVQNFGRGYLMLLGPYAADLVEEPDQGYEPADMIGVEQVHVFDDEGGGWRQLTLSAFMVDRTFLHQSFPYDEGRIRYKDGGVGNTRWPENLMATYDVMNRPLGRWGQLSYQASVVRWGRTYGAERGEWWGTLGGDVAIPLHGSVEDTLRGRYTQVRLFVEGVRRENFLGVAGRHRDYLSASAEYMRGPWVLDLTTTQRWTRDRVLPLQKDALYTATLGYALPSQTVAAISLTREQVGDREGVYAGLRLTQTLTVCSRCIARGRYY